MKKDISIDELLRDTWLMVVALRNGAVAEQGDALYQKGIELVEKARQRMVDAGYSAETVDTVSYAQCALLDETVLNRPKSDDGYDTWMRTPLQARFFNTLQAGEVLYERVRQSLQQPGVDPLILTCLHRVLMMGFEGRYRNHPQQERQALLDALAQKVGPFTVQEGPDPLLVDIRREGRGLRYLRSLWFWSGLAVLAVIGVWFGLHYQLQQLLSAWLSANQS
ncbi:type VI secretion system protein TssL, short form [Brenneria sp. g21c3]|uniref:type VI secretion system protein TssL, short form n=1 Tax=Brenneria sp. g21c3 TaxID=3093893 RepID=UPI002EAB6FAD|nr:type VI secretion system protein TssL, short form [Brenneria sp. g21c3]